MPAVRARDHGIVIGRLQPGAGNAITDVAGVVVGHASHTPDNTGVTVVVPRAGSDSWLEPAYAGVAVLNGAGELTGSIQIREWGVMETPVFLTATPYVGAVYHAATQVLGERQPAIGVDDVIIPVVGECDSSGVVDVVAGPAPDAALVAAALDGARSGPVAEGQVGAGIGMHCCDFAGGIGTASRQVEGYTVGVLLLVNFGDWEELRFAGRLAGVEAPARGVDGSCIAVVATDAPLLPQGLERLARRAFLGLARAGSYASNGSGEIAIAFSTANGDCTRRDAPAVVRPELLRSEDQHSWLFAACTEAAEEAVINALLGAHTLTGPRGTAHAFPVDRLPQA
jgi:D-aminopeptidase